MAEVRAQRPGRLIIGVVQLFLVVAAGALWVAARLPWVQIQSFDGLGPPKQVTLSGASWSTALLPLALLVLATAVAAVAVRGWPLRALAGMLAATSFAVGYLGLSLWVVPDVAARAADLAQVPTVSLVGSERHYGGAGVAVAAALCVLIAAVLLMRAASLFGPVGEVTAKYAAPAVRRSLARDAAIREKTPEMSERMLWDALDEGRDPTNRPPRADIEGR